MSKSLKRVKQVLLDNSVRSDVLEMAAETRTAHQAAAAAGCHVDQIAKSIVFQGQKTGQVFLFVTRGGHSVDPAKASMIANEKLTRADAKAVRATTGFAIGGVAPIGHLSRIPVFLDRGLLDFGLVWAAGGTPRHIFSIQPEELAEIFDCQVTDFTT